MSWFDATGFANLAKSALKGAQKTIDKALDIKEEEPKVIQSHAVETSDFFASWGLQSEQEANKRDGNPQKQQQNSSSIWGSFTGSFFEPPKAGVVDRDGWKTVKHSKSLESTASQDEQQHSMVSSTSAPEKLATKDTKLALAKSESVHKEDEGESSAINEPVNMNRTVSKESNDKTASESCVLSEQSSLDNVVSISTDKTVTKSASLDLEQIYYAPTADNTDSDSTTSTGGDEEEQCDDVASESNDHTSSPTNVFQKIPNISSESDKKSMESVEILGSQSNTDCTTTPESDLNSVTNSLSPSVVGIKVNSESVEILPDSLVTSPSSVEILGDWKSDSSPYLSPIDPKNLESPILDEEECATPCIDCTGTLQPPSRDQFAEASSSDISPYESPMEEVKTLNISPYPYSVDSTPSPNAFSSLDTNKSSSHVTDSSKTSPESVEVIPDVDEPDEVSLAEDSYTSASEGTVMTVLEPLQQLDTVKNKMELADMNMKMPIKMHDSCPDDRQTSAKVCMESKLNLSLDSLKEKHNLHLTLEAITTQPIRKLDHLEGVNEKPDVSTFSQLMSTTIEPPDPDSQVENMEETKMIDSNTDQYLISTDSSREGTLIESSSEDNATLICTSDSKVLETPLTTSSYVKTMLADAMVEKSEIIDMEAHCTEVPRENSPISSERYHLIHIYRLNV